MTIVWWTPPRGTARPPAVPTHGGPDARCVVWVRLVRNTNGDGRAPSGNAVKGFGKEIANIPCARVGHGIGAGFVRDGALDPKEDGKQRWKERWREEAEKERRSGWRRPWTPGLIGVKGRSSAGL